MKRKERKKGNVGILGNTLADMLIYLVIYERRIETKHIWYKSIVGKGIFAG